MSILLVINSEKPPLKRKFLHYSVTKNVADNKISLIGWEEVYYQHPHVDIETTGEVGVPVIESYCVATYTLGSYDAGVLETFEAAHRAIYNVHKPI